MHSELCPICHGTGKIEDKTTTAGNVTCHGCGGKGWIEVSNDKSFIPYIAPIYIAPIPLHYPYHPYYPNYRPDYPGSFPYLVCVNFE